ncbi:hypothetical protein [Deinococcus hopiensis]|uniref:hypothetical protein n=1 Tax=Deinococcus hopiensis TaxID=309885 RepID=UPI00111BFFFD|nr:hypothetical protein [Deinococcus hopiensis]
MRFVRRAAVLFPQTMPDRVTAKLTQTGPEVYGKARCKAGSKGPRAHSAKRLSITVTPPDMFPAPVKRRRANRVHTARAVKQEGYRAKAKSGAAVLSVDSSAQDSGSSGIKQRSEQEKR